MSSVAAQVAAETIDPLVLEGARAIHRSAMEVARTRSRNEVVDLGRRLVITIKEPNAHDVGHLNVLAAVLEEVREIYRERFTPASATEPVDPRPRPIEVPEGTFTVEYPDGSYETLRIRREAWADGKAVASFLSGPDNETSFTGFAFVGLGPEVRVWSRFANLKGSRKVDALRVILLGDPEENAGLREAYAMRSGRCGRCGRKLTVPASLHRGLGPECAEKLGL